MGKIIDRLVEEGKLLEEKEGFADEIIDDLYISMKFKSGHIHTVNPDDKTKQELLSAEIEKPKLNNNAPDEVIFKNRQAIGDILTMTAGVRDFKLAFPNTKVGVITTATHLWDNNPYIDHQLKEGNIIDIGPGSLTNKSNRIDFHMINAYRMSMEDKLGLIIPPTRSIPDVWMTQDEVNREPLIKSDYWLISPYGAPGWPLKQYHRWQEVVNILKYKIRFVQIGIGRRPVLDGVINYTGKTNDRNTGLRDLFNLFYHAQGSIGLVSMHMHLSAAFGNPCVVVAGAREPAHFTHYQGHQYISTDNCLPCATTACWKCKLEGCKNLNKDNVPKCVEIIQPEQVAGALLKYYDGGVLQYGKKRKSTFKNIVKERKVFSIPKEIVEDGDIVEKFGFSWGGSAITDRDWKFIKDIIIKNNVKTVLEFGCGLSTLLLQNYVDHIESYETNSKYSNIIKPYIDTNKVDINIWNGKDCSPKKDKYDLVFVDGPGGANREFSTKIGIEHTNNLIIQHDAGRPHEKEMASKYIDTDKFDKFNGGTRTTLWTKKKEPVIIDPNKPTMRFVTTSRGYGGSEKSSIYLMNEFKNQGWNVIFHSTGNTCGPFSNDIQDITKEPFSELNKPCDLLVYYCSDTIWNLSNPEWNVMNNVQAKRKCMIINYKVGGIGQKEWTKGWDKYICLNTELESVIKERMPDCKTSIVFPPIKDSKQFFDIEPMYDTINIVRHSSQRDSKWPSDSNDYIKRILNHREEINMYLMPPRSDCIEHERLHKFKVNEVSVSDFLSLGNVFWYHLPKGYTEGAGRVIMEAMMCGIPCIVDNHSGPACLVTDESGWKCNSIEEMYNVIDNLTLDEIKRKGNKARERAIKEFNPQRWIEELKGDN